MSHVTTIICRSRTHGCRLQVAALIHSLQLERNGATLLLSNLLDEEDGDDDALTRPATKVRRPAESPARCSAGATQQNYQEFNFLLSLTCRHSLLVCLEPNVSVVPSGSVSRSKATTVCSRPVACARTLALCASKSWQGNEGKDAALRQVEVDLALNAHANARWHHELRKKHLGKLQKTVDANAKAFKAAEKRTNTQLVQVLPCKP